MMMLMMTFVGVVVVVAFHPADGDGFWYDDGGHFDKLLCDDGSEGDDVDADGTGCRNDDGYVGDEDAKAEENEIDDCGCVAAGSFGLELSLLLYRDSLWLELLSIRWWP